MVEVWVLCDDRRGNVNQALGVAEHLAVPYVQKDITYTALARLPNCLKGASFAGLSPESKAHLRAPWPDLVIAAGRRTAPVARALKKASKGKTRLVQIMDPGGCGFKDFDLVAIPSHDQPGPQSNVLEIIGAPHRVMPAQLAEMQRRWAPVFEAYPKPHIALVIGGATKNKTFSVDQAKTLCAEVNQLRRQNGGSVLLTTSRRTGDLAQVLISHLEDPTFVYQWGQSGENPFLGIVASADYMIVSGDSVSMCCEVTQGAAPVHIFAPDEMMSEKHKRLHDSLYHGGYAVPFEGELSTEKGPALNSAKQIAQEIKTRLL